MNRILHDNYFHAPAGHRIAPHLTTGHYTINVGRYQLGDCWHPNGLATLESELAAGYELRKLVEPYSAASLFDADILLVTNPDYPLYPGASPHRWTPDDVDALLDFVERGGGVLLCVNSFLSRPDFWEENFDIERVSVLFERLGMRWDPNFMSSAHQIEPARSGRLVVGYGQGGRVWQGRLPRGARPLLRYKGNVYGFLLSRGAGKLAVVGDTGMISNGLMCFPGFENTAFVTGLLRELTPAWSNRAPRRFSCNRFRHVSASPSPSGMDESSVRGLQPKARWTVDHHYRHLTWELPRLRLASAAAWKNLPFDLSLASTASRIEAMPAWLRLDSDDAGPPCPIQLHVHRNRGPAYTDVHLLGRTQSRSLTWNDLCRDRAFRKKTGKLVQVDATFEARVVLTPDGTPKAVRWSQGQRCFARSAKAWHYGWEIILTSASGVIVPDLAARA